MGDAAVTFGGVLGVCGGVFAACVGAFEYRSYRDYRDATRVCGPQPSDENKLDKWRACMRPPQLVENKKV